MKSTHWLLLFICFEMEKEYWTETQWRFLKKCCDFNLQQHNILVKVTSPLYVQEEDVLFENISFETVLHEGLCITGRVLTSRGQESRFTSLPAEYFKEGEHEMKPWVKAVMRVVFDYWTMTYKHN